MSQWKCPWQFNTQYVSHELFSYETDMIFLVQTSDYSFVDHATDVHDLYKVPLSSSKKCLQKLHKVTGETVLGVFCYAQYKYSSPKTGCEGPVQLYSFFNLSARLGCMVNTVLWPLYSWEFVMHSALIILKLVTKYCFICKMCILLLDHFCIV
jgi:hypothetical protein